MKSEISVPYKYLCLSEYVLNDCKTLNWKFNRGNLSQNIFIQQFLQHGTRKNRIDEESKKSLKTEKGSRHFMNSEWA